VAVFSNAVILAPLSFLLLAFVLLNIQIKKINSAKENYGTTFRTLTLKDARRYKSLGVQGLLRSKERSRDGDEKKTLSSLF